MTEDDVIAWINLYLDLSKSINCTSQLASAVIFPNQKGSLKLISALSYDNNIPEAVKDLAETADTAISWRSILLDQRISGYETNSPKGVSDVYHSIKDAFDKSSNKLVIAKHALALAAGENTDREYAYTLLDKVFGDMPLKKQIPNADGFDWEAFVAYTIEKVSGEIASLGNISAFAQKVSTEESQWDHLECVAWIDAFLRFAIYSYRNGKYKSKVTELAGHGVWVNQLGDFCMLDDLYCDGDISEELKDLANNSIVGINYREKLLDPSSELASVLKEKIISQKDVLTAIDGCLEKYTADKQNSEFRSLIFTLVEIDKRLHISESMRYFRENKEKLIVGSLDKGRTMSLVAELIQMGDEKLERVLRSLGKEDDDTKIDVVDKNGELVKAAISLSDTPYGGLGADGMRDALCDAKKMVKDRMEAEGYQFTCGLCEDSYSCVYGVQKDGVEYPLVVHSYIDNTSRPFQLTSPDWEQLSRPNSMLWVHTRSRLYTIPFYALAKDCGTINISFSASNFDIADRSKALAQVLRYFKGLHFDFGNILPVCSDEIQLFNVPERPIREALGAKEDDMLQ